MTSIIIRPVTKTFGELRQGERFMKDNVKFMRMESMGHQNAVNLEDGSTNGFPDSMMLDVYGNDEDRKVAVSTQEHMDWVMYGENLYRVHREPGLLRLCGDRGIIDVLSDTKVLPVIELRIKTA